VPSCAGPVGAPARSGWPTASRETSFRSTSGAWGCSSTPRPDAAGVSHALIFTPRISRYIFVWLCFSYTTPRDLTDEIDPHVSTAWVAPDERCSS